MTFKINGTTIPEPTSDGWKERSNYGNSGRGNPLYSGSREFELQWNLLPIDDFNILLTAYNTVSTTGTATVELPYFDSSSYGFHEYSGCVLSEPVFRRYFVDHVEDVSMLIAKIRG